MRGLRVDIRLSTIGDLGILMSSLLYHAKFLSADGIELPSDPFKFLPAKRNGAPVPEEHKPYIIYAHRKGAVAVWYDDLGLPTSAEKGVKVDYDAVSQGLISPEIETHYVAYSPIYGGHPFTRDPKVKDVVEKRANKFTYRDMYAYAFGTSSRFSGVISSMPDLFLVGWGYKDRRPGYHRVPLVYYAEQTAWYNKVIDDVRASYCSLFGVRHRYSFISSLVFVSKKTVQMLLDSPFEDGNVYLSDIVGRKRNEVRTGKVAKFKSWLKKDEPEDREQIVPREIRKKTTNTLEAQVPTAFAMAPPLPSLARIAKMTAPVDFGLQDYEAPPVPLDGENDTDDDDEEGKDEEEEEVERHPEKVDYDAVNPDDG